MSNIAMLYEKGCRGINVEPDPVFYEKPCRERPEDINLNCGIGAESGTLNYYFFDRFPFLNGFSKEDAEMKTEKYGHKIKEVIPIKIMSINDLLKEYCTSAQPDFLDIDAEGMDLEILRKFDYGIFSPKVIIAEMVIYGSVRKETAIRDLLTAKGYTAPYETPINTIFVRKDCWEKML